MHSKSLRELPAGPGNTYLTYQIRCIATYIYVEIHKMLNFPSICSGDWNICAEYVLRGRLPLTEAFTLTGTRKPTVRCLITRPDSEAWLSLMGTLVIIRMPRIWKHADFRPNQFQNIAFTYKQSNTTNDFANETACINRVLIYHVCIYLKLSIEQNYISFIILPEKSLCDVKAFLSQ